ncbi:MAG TPA: MgtC/SapB family protein [Acidiferrobacteraceae bacterium]|nr:MgtC/SapB family protein [Acidiferrobacteraceae bacterium]
MDETSLTSLVRLLAAVAAGGFIGLERTYHGRPAGFRTHTLVCTASSLLMLVTVYQLQLIDISVDVLRIDPTRLAQGIMTGIGFLGAGVIMKEGLSVRGLTTAASIWMTASIGILIGIGFYFPALIATLLTVGTLALFRYIEHVAPSHHYAVLSVRSLRKENLSLDDLCKLIKDLGMTTANASYRLNQEGKFFQYRMTIRGRDETKFRQLAEMLITLDKVSEFDLTPVGGK